MCGSVGECVWESQKVTKITEEKTDRQLQGNSAPISSLSLVITSAYSVFLSIREHIVKQRHLTIAPSTLQKDRKINVNNI